MLKKSLKLLAIMATLSGLTYSAYGHGLIESPGSRNYFCGEITKPDEVLYGEPEYVECAEVFVDETGNIENDGYNYMSVLSHTGGALAVETLPNNVCGFDSESFGNGETLWDKPINWPTNPMVAGSQEFSWNISYGPHFSDTEHFRYWITKPDYQFAVGKKITWNDLEPAPFCELQWDDSNPSNNSDDIWTDKPNSRFHMVCEVPEREGRHIIYAEWGRDQSTLERFHSCIDVEFNGDSNGEPPVVGAVEANIVLEPAIDEFYGAGNIVLNGQSSEGDDLSYQWSVNAQNPELYTLTDADQAMAYLTLANPDAAADITISLHVSNGDISDNATQTIKHFPAEVNEWMDLGALTQQALTLEEGDKVSVRAVLENGQDVYYPQQALEITEETTAADVWPYTLAQQINQENRDLLVGVLNTDDDVVAVQHATLNKMFAQSQSTIKSAYLQIEKPVADQNACSIRMQNGASAWWAGFDIFTDAQVLELDFSNTGLDLSKIRLDQGVFQATLNGQKIRLVKPSWVNKDTAGYMGMNANGYDALASFDMPTCKDVS